MGELFYEIEIEDGDTCVKPHATKPDWCDNLVVDGEDALRKELLYYGHEPEDVEQVLADLEAGKTSVWI
jgi:hypothetical protein